MGLEQHADIDRGQKGRCITGTCGIDRDRRIILHQAFQGAGRRLAGDTSIERRRQPVDIRPRSLPAGARLLRGGEAWREDGGHRLCATGDIGSGRTEIDQRRRTIGPQHDVGRLDVAVQEADAVDLLETIEQRRQDLLDRGLRQARLARQALRKRLALEKLHDDIGRAVRLEEIVNPDDRRHMTQLRHGSRLVEEAAAPPDEILGHFGRARQHLGVTLADRQPARQVLLDRDVAMKLCIVATIGNAEAALAQHRQNLVAPDQESVGQRRVILGPVDRRLLGRPLGHVWPLNSRGSVPPQSPFVTARTSGCCALHRRKPVKES